MSINPSGTVPARAKILLFLAPMIWLQAVASPLLELEVKSGQIVSGPKVLRVARGDRIVIKVRSDVADQLHVHGYDVHATLKANEFSEVTLVASRTGRFTLELHKQHVTLGALEVYPR